MSTFIIRNKTTLELWRTNVGKSSWSKVGHAKAAFSYNTEHLRKDPSLSNFINNLGKYDSLKFKDQDVYEVLELLSDSEDKLKKLTELVESNTNLLRCYPEGSEHVDCMEVISNIAKILGVEVNND